MTLLFLTLIKGKRRKNVGTFPDTMGVNLRSRRHPRSKSRLTIDSRSVKSVPIQAMASYAGEAMEDVCAIFCKNPIQKLESESNLTIHYFCINQWRKSKSLQVK